ncbi:MAG: alcohol dehydrogenase catalytic domain-containing protein [Nitrospirae bacterium]|nr:alcohol dehydrogenase catalytic domain-containing protein [Nitrospirota bacterium]
MKALVYNEHLVLRTDYPRPASDEALIRVTYAGICNTDIEITKGYMGFSGVLGHEFAGVVEETDDKELINKRVVGEINLNCGRCSYCLNGMQSHCPNRSVLGILNRDGVFAGYVTLPLKNIHVIPDNVPDEEAVFVEPLAAAFEITRQVKIRQSDNVCILGDGKLGLLTAQVISLSGCNLTVVGKHDNKLAILGGMGIETLILSEFDKKGFDIVIDATGSPSGLKTALDIVRPGGMIVLKTTTAEACSLNINSIVVNEVTLVGSRCGPFDKAIWALASKKINVLPLISRVFSLDDGIEAFEYASGRDALKVILKI